MTPKRRRALIIVGIVIAVIAGSVAALAYFNVLPTGIFVPPAEKGPYSLEFNLFDGMIDPDATTPEQTWLGGAPSPGCDLAGAISQASGSSGPDACDLSDIAGPPSEFGPMYGRDGVRKLGTDTGYIIIDGQALEDQGLVPGEYNLDLLASYFHEEEPAPVEPYVITGHVFADENKNNAYDGQSECPDPGFAQNALVTVLEDDQTTPADVFPILTDTDCSYSIVMQDQFTGEPLTGQFYVSVNDTALPGNYSLSASFSNPSGPINIDPNNPQRATVIEEFPYQPDTGPVICENSPAIAGLNVNYSSPGTQFIDLSITANDPDIDDQLTINSLTWTPGEDTSGQSLVKSGTDYSLTLGHEYDGSSQTYNGSVELIDKCGNTVSDTFTVDFSSTTSSFLKINKAQAQAGPWEQRLFIAATDDPENFNPFLDIYDPDKLVQINDSGNCNLDSVDGTWSRITTDCASGGGTELKLRIDPGDSLVIFGAGPDSLRVGGLAFNEVVEVPPQWASGIIWEDRNQDGIVDSDEPGIEKAVIELWSDANANQVIDSGDEIVSLATSRADGTYELLPGIFPPRDPEAVLINVSERNWDADGPLADFNTESTAQPNPYPGNLIDGPILDANFGFYRAQEPTGSITGLVFDDNFITDGIHQRDEAGIGQVSLSLYVDENADQQLDAGDTLLTENELTDSSGAYQFDTFFTTRDTKSMLIEVVDPNFDPGQPLDGYSPTTFPTNVAYFDYDSGSNLTGMDLGYVQLEEPTSLNIFKTCDPPEAVAPGDLITYEVRFSPSVNDPAAINVVMDDLMPRDAGGNAQVEYVSESMQLRLGLIGTFQSLTDAADADEGQYNAADNSLTVNLDQLTSDALTGGATLIFNARALSGLPDQTVIENIATVDADNAEPNQHSCLITVVSPNDVATLNVSKSAPATAEPGETITYSVSVTNSGPDTADNVVLQDYFDKRYLTIDTISGNGQEIGTSDPVYGLIEWTYPTIASGETITETVTATIIDPMPDGTTIIEDTLAANADNAQQAQTTVETEVTDEFDGPLLTSTKLVEDVNSGNVEPGDLIQYVITVNNEGTQSIDNVSVTDDMPQNVHGLEIVSIPSGATDNSDPSGGANGTGRVDVSGFSLSPDESAQVIYRITIDDGVADGTVIENVGTVSGTSNGNPVEPGTTPGTTTTVGQTVGTDRGSILASAISLIPEAAPVTGVSPWVLLALLSAAALLVVVLTAIRSPKPLSR